MLTGREKAKILLDFLGSNATRVLAHLQPRYAQTLTSSIEDAPEISQQELHRLIGEVLENRQRFQTLNANQVGISVERIPQHQDYQSQQEAHSAAPQLTEGSTDSSLLNSDEGSSYQEPETPKVEPRIEKMARILSKQRPNMIAFFLHYLEDPDKTLIWNELPFHLQRSAGAVEIENVPASRVMFEKLYDMIMNDPDFENSSITAPKGLEEGEDSQPLFEEHEDVLQGAVDLLSGALENGLGYSGEQDSDEDDDDEDDDDEDEGHAFFAEKRSEAPSKKSSEKPVAQVSEKSPEPVEMHNLSLSEGTESLKFPDLNMEIGGSDIDSAFHEDESIPVNDEPAFVEAPRHKVSSRAAASSAIFDEDLLGPDF